jgi:3-aminobutyryl-CoA ammonia-lyase
VATEVCIRTDGDQGLLASYADEQFQAPVRAGDVLEVTAVVIRVGRRSRTLRFTAAVVARGNPKVSESAARMLEEPIVATTATGTVVVPEPAGPRD